jgi:hypothetical protein
LRELEPAPQSQSTAEQLVGISIRAALHFHPTATLDQQETAIEKLVNAIDDEIVRIEVDQTFRVNDLQFVLRSTCQDVVADVGALEILLWRGGEPEPLVGKYVLDPGERLIVEPSVQPPIDIRPFEGSSLTKV